MKYLLPLITGVCLGLLMFSGLDRQVQAETVANGHIAYRVCAPLMPVFDGDKWECRS